MLSETEYSWFPEGGAFQLPTLTYRGFNVRYDGEYTAQVNGLAVRAASFAMFVHIIDDHLAGIHSWLTDFREMVKLIRGEILLPHEAPACFECNQALTLVLEARAAKLPE